MPARLAGLKKLIHKKSIPSTQTLARRLADAGAPAWTVVRADAQTRGRGRMDRRWASGRGGLFMSLIIRPKIAPACLPKISLEAGRAAAEAIEAASGVRTLVKLPNDVMVRDAETGTFRKIAGILIEAAGTSSRLDWVVVGIGVNANNRVPPPLRAQAASLSALAGREIDLEALFRRLFRAFRKSWRGSR